MSRIDDLIAEYCPNGVERKPLGAIAKLYRGNGLQKKDFTDKGIGQVRCVSAAPPAVQGLHDLRRQGVRPGSGTAGELIGKKKEGEAPLLFFSFSRLARRGPPRKGRRGPCPGQRSSRWPLAPPPIRRGSGPGRPCWPSTAIPLWMCWTTNTMPTTPSWSSSSGRRRGSGKTP